MRLGTDRLRIKKYKFIYQMAFRKTLPAVSVPMYVAI